MQDLNIVEQMQVPQILYNQWIENLFFFHLIPRLSKT